MGLSQKMLSEKVEIKIWDFSKKDSDTDDNTFFKGKHLEIFWKTASCIVCKTYIS